MSENKLTAAAFLRWVETQPPGETYPFTNARTCACARYAQTLGVSDFSLQVIYNPEGFWAGMDRVARGDDEESDWTYGRLAERLRRIA